MAVVSCKLKRGLAASYGTYWKHRYTDEYTIEVDSEMARFAIVQAATSAQPDPLPSLLTPHTEHGVEDRSSYLQNVDLRQHPSDKRLWTAICQYEPLNPNQTALDYQQTPLSRPVKWRIEWIEESGIVEKDINGQPITNTVGDEFDTPIERPKLYPVLVAEKTYSTVEAIIALGMEYHDSVNSATFRGGGPRTVKFLPIQSSEIQQENGVDFYVASMRFAYNPLTWDVEILNRGWRYRPAAGQTPVKALDKETRLPVSTPVLLAENGTLLAEGAAKHYVKGQVLKLKDFNGIFA